MVGLSCVMASFPLFAQNDACPYANNVTIIGVSQPVIRLNGNAIRAYSESNATGTNRVYWSAYIEAWLTRSGSQIGHYPLWSPGVNSFPAGRTFTATLETFGPGTYQQSAYHAFHSSYCASYPGGAWRYLTGNPNTSYTLGAALAVQRPTIYYTDAPPYYLGGPLQSGTYRSTVTLQTAPNGAPETPVYSFLANGSPGPPFGQLSCTTCFNPIYTAVRASACNVYDVVLKVSYNGFSSDPLWISNGVPSGMEDRGLHHHAKTPGYVSGWQSYQHFKVLNACGHPMNWVGVNESFPSAARVFSEPTNWQLPKPHDPNGWELGVWDSPSQFDPFGEFIDKMYELYHPSITPGKTPLPMDTGTNGYNRNAASTVTTMEQVWKAGTNQPGQGLQIRQNTQKHYLDHGAHQ